MAVSYGSLPFEEQIQFFLGKKQLITSERWSDVYGAEHDVGFMVAGVTKAELLADFQSSIARAVTEGGTLAEFRKDFKALVKQHGWTGWKGEGSKAGEAWRTLTIYDTNLRQSYHAGRWAQMWDARDRRPYLVYRHNDGVAHPRIEHKSWDFTVVPIDSNWARTHQPQNGYGCQCWSYTINDRQLAKMGKSGPDTPDESTYEWTNPSTGKTHQIPVGIQPGFDYPAGGSRVDFMRGVVERKAAGPTLGEALSQKLLQEVQHIPAAPVAPVVAATEPVSVGTLGGSTGPSGSRLIPSLPAISLQGMDVEVADGVRDVLTAIAKQKKDWLPHGVKALKVTDASYLAATDQRGYFALSRRVDPTLQQSGYDLVTKALTAIRDGKPLSFEEEYGIETLWHEIRHNAQRHLVPDTPLEVVRIAEGLHQLLARQTYPDLLQLLGTDAAHAKPIRENGPAYPKTVARLSGLFKRLGILDDDYVVEVNALKRLLDLNMQTDFISLPSDLAKTLKSVNARGKVDIDAALQAIAEGRDP